MKNYNLLISIIFLITVSISMVTGCTILSKSIDTTVKTTADSIEKYCQELDEDVRELFRNRLNDRLNGKAKIKVECARLLENGH